MSIHVTRPSLPSLDELLPLLEDIWDSRQLSNMGKYHAAFEKALCDYLKVSHVNLFCNGTMALQTALQALRITGEVITTPFSFAATTHAIYWNRCTPVFCDIDPGTLTLDPERIEALITPQTTAILPTHAFGFPCNVEAIERIASIYGLKVVYDAAPAFGVTIDGESIFNKGDLSIVSFHATKVLNTFEGGGIFSQDANLKRRIDFLKNFGIADETTVVAPGSNGKMNEFQAAVGLLQVKDFNCKREKSKHVFNRYVEAFSDQSGLRLVRPRKGIEWNYSYCPVLVDKKSFGADREQVYAKLKEHDIHPRRYYYPLISDFPSYRDLKSAGQHSLSVASEISEAVICLPIYPDLAPFDQEKIIDLVLSCRGGQ